ncbi:MAG TPA: helix-turn-helix domain-containing protein [Acidimicrobiia bacterium]|nr:helix-turn-helix domain-containing protein [Acidimicrobiia bacterium]
MAGEDIPKGGLGTVRNATLLLQLLSEGDRYQSLSSLAERSGLSLATTHRVLRSLAQAELVSQHSQSSRYSLGPGLFRLGGAYRDRLPLLQVLAPYLLEVRDNTKATIEVSLLVQGVVVVADRVTGENVTRVFRDNTSYHPPLKTAAGRVLLAHTDLDTWDEVIAKAGPGAPTPADREQWSAAAHLVHVLDDSGEFQVAVPVRDVTGSVIAALSGTARLPFLGEQDQRLEEHIARQLQRTAEMIRPSLTDS